MLRGEARTRRPGMPYPSAGVECPYIGAQPLVQWSLAAPKETVLRAKIGASEPNCQLRGSEEIWAQSRRPIRTQSWVLRSSAMLMARHMPIAVNATVKAKAA